MPGGRPTDYKPEYVEGIIEYFDQPAFEVMKDDDGKPYTDNKGAPVMLPTPFPTKAGYACKLGIHRDTLHEWANAKGEDNKLKHPDFSDAYKRCEGYQEQKLVTNALNGSYQANFSIFTAKNVIGWRDKQEHSHTIRTLEGMMAELDDK